MSFFSQKSSLGDNRNLGAMGPMLAKTAVLLLCLALSLDGALALMPMRMLRKPSLKAMYSTRICREAPFFHTPQVCSKRVSLRGVPENIGTDEKRTKQQRREKLTPPQKIISTQPQKIISIDLSKYEEKEKHEMEWLVETTSKILGLDDGEPQTPAGSMSEHLTRRALKLMRAWSRRSSEPHVVDLILRRLVTEVAAGNQHVRMTTRTYNVVLDAWSKSNVDGAPERSEALLDQMEKQYTDGNSKMRPNTKSYHSVMKSYVNNERWKHSCFHKVNDLFSRLSDLASEDKEPKESTSLNRGSYNLMLCAIANSQLKDKGERASQVLSDMLAQFATGDERAKPNTNSFNFAIRAWSTTTSCSNYCREQKIEDFFQELVALDVPPNTETFNYILAVYLKSRNPSKLSKIQETLATMEASFEAGNEAAKPDRVTVNTIVAASATEATHTAVEVGRKLEKKYGVEPDTVSNNILIDCLSKSGRRDAAAKAVTILGGMERDFKIGMSHLKPDVYTYSSVIDSFAKCGGDHSAQKAQAILERMRQLYLTHGGDPANASVFNAAINAWASSEEDDAEEHAMAILLEMEGRHEMDPFIPKPDIMTYNTIFKVLSKGSDQGAMQADDILTKLEQKSEFSTDAFSYTAVITAYGRSRLEDKAEKAYSVLQRMIASYQGGNPKARPGVRAFNSALNACAFVGGKSKKKVEAFFILVAITMEMNKMKIKADHTTYGTILRACSTLLPPGDKRRKELVDSIFRKACKEGQVGHMVLKQMKFAASSGQYRNLLGRDRTSPVRTKDLPVSWTCNVRENRGKRER